MTLAQARNHIGQKVVYRGVNGVAEGVITSVTLQYVFVRYGSDVHSKCTRADALELISRGP